MKNILKLAIAFLALFSFAACSDVPMPYDEPGNDNKNDTTITDQKGSTQDNPLSVAEAVDLITSGKAPSTEVYVKGIVTSVDYYSSQYKSLSYYISDDGKTQQLDVYSGKGLNGADFASKSDLKVGQTIIVKGIIKSYTDKNGKTTNEIDKNSQIVSIEGNGTTPDTPSSGEAKGTGTEADPYNATAANKAAAALDKDGKIENVYVSGIISKIESVSTQYGNAEFYISDDGTTEGTQFLIYRAYYLNGAKFTAEDQIKVGQKVVVKGTLVNFNGSKPEMTTGGQIVSIDGSGNTTPDTPTSGDAVSINGTTVTMTNSAATAGTETAKLDLSTLGLADGTAVENLTFSDGTKLTFGKGSNDKNAPKFYTKTKGVRVYLNNTLTFSASKPIAKIVFTCDALSGTNYVGNKAATVTFSGNTAVYTNSDSSVTSGGGVQLRVQTITITYAK